MTEISPDVEQQLAGMTEQEWSTLSARVRAPDSTEQLRTVAGRFLTGAPLDALIAGADVSKFVGDDGQIDENKVTGVLTAMFGDTQQQQPQWGQHSGQAPGSGPGAKGKAEAHKRFGTGEPHPATGPGPSKGQAGKAEAAKRFGSKS